jgi:hypothetical protein
MRGLFTALHGLRWLSRSQPGCFGCLMFLGALTLSIFFLWFAFTALFG